MQQFGDGNSHLFPQMKEAEAIEAQIRAKGPGGAPGPQPPAQPGFPGEGGGGLIGLLGINLTL